jgi:phenylacetate-CoA ligase
MAVGLPPSRYAHEHFEHAVARARRDNPFYRRWIAQPEAPPILDRATYLAHNDEILNGYPVTVRTSGSTGVPVKISHSQSLTRMMERDNARFAQLLGGLLPRAVIAHVHADPAPPDRLSIEAPIDQQLAFLERRRQEVGVQAITTYPSNAERLADAVIDRGLDMSHVVRFGMFSETVEDRHLEVVKRAFPNARIWTSYSSREFGMIAFRCPYEQEHHHIVAHRLGVELVRDDGTPTEIGERGRVLITDYFNTQSPFIRYEIGDFAVREPCPCGKIKLPAFRRIDGKIREALLLRSGERLHFAGLSATLRDLPGMERYQVVQHALEHFKVRLISKVRQHDGVRAAFRKHLGYLPGHIDIEYMDDIPLGPSGKFHASISEI